MTSSASDAYSLLASSYDRLEQGKSLLRRGRAQSLAALAKHLPSGGRLLELGCGTGTEAVALARELQARIVAFDPSPAMVAVARRKAQEEALDIDVRQGSAAEAVRALDREQTRFDGAWASFSLAYDAPLGDLRSPLARILTPGAPFLCSLPNPWVVAAPWRIPARLLGLARNRVAGCGIPIRATAPRAASRALAPDFALLEFRALSVLVPPSRLQRAWNALGPVAAFLEAWDERVSSRRGFRSVGDHTLMVFRRASTDALPAGPSAPRPLSAP